MVRLPLVDLTATLCGRRRPTSAYCAVIVAFGKVAARTRPNGSTVVARYRTDVSLVAASVKLIVRIRPAES